MSGVATAASRRRGANGCVDADGPADQLLSLDQELGRQQAAASFLRGGWLRSARLALTAATQAQLLTEEVTAAGGGRTALPDARTLGAISRAAFDDDDRSRILQVLHRRLAKFDEKLWREPYRALVVVERLLVHGPCGVAGELPDDDAAAIAEMSTLQHIDEKGFDWGQTVRSKAERVLKLIGDPSFLTEQRDEARRVSHEIQGFGSFGGCLTHSSSSSTPIETDQRRHTLPTLPPLAARRSNSSRYDYESVSTEEPDDSDGDEPDDHAGTAPFLAGDEEPKKRDVHGHGSSAMNSSS